ncbi:Methyltransferase domain-containing protein [Streptomyces sp. Ag82_O1-12]|uniref:class I SAM-dependent methyltransferase n=1 Tax=unclassified Streptomyces TaxID=2593676 RepID=UPI000BC9EB2A|nr:MULTISPECIES: class I SAM-dependent methyltransferase [unclassified Streptomyces]SMQ20175.1 Methyltransferase domain-containing protein [Streptomyces sp. Ag82_O1-12]SOD49120.1 Methyltransferase domain-containing protein [Streptomyces sp. Ag82_G6-1]
MAHDHDHKPAHSHHHEHTDLDWAEMGPMLESSAELFASLYERALGWLAKEVTEPGLIVDVGSGPGVVACLFAETFPGARIVAVDGSEPLLERARARAGRQGVADRFGTLTGELPDVLGELDYPADLLWASRSLHHLGDQRAALAAFAARLAPGGTLALMEGGLPPRFLPRDFGIGRPGLQARIDAVEAEWFTRMRTELPGHVAETENWPALLAAAGLKHTRSHSFLLDLPAPASDRARAYVVASLSFMRDKLAEGLDAEDLSTVDRLLDPDDEASLHHRPDVFVLEAHTVHTAVRPA